jgi:hypothetical protein
MKTPHPGDPPTPAASRPKKPPAAARIVRVHSTKDGYAVFGEHGLALSEPFPSREDAIAEAKLILGGPGAVIVVGETGQVLAEVIRHA